MNGMTRQRIRLRYMKDDVLMYVGHRDMLNYVLRLLRKADLPVALSEGFSPKPKITFGPALTLGVMADNELLDIEVRDGTVLSAEELNGYLSALVEAARPREFALGLDTLDPETRSIARQAVAARYVILPEGEHGPILEMLESAELTWVKPDGKAVDLKPAILGYASHGDGIEVTGSVSGSATLNIANLCRLIAQRTGTDVAGMRRTNLLDADGNEL